MKWNTFFSLLSFYCQEDALTAEADLRLAMEADGFVVEGGTEKLGVRRRELGIDSNNGDA